MRAFIIIAIFVQALLVIHYGEGSSTSYRREERFQAIRNWKQFGTSEAKAALDRENELLDQHISSKQTAGMVGLACLLVINALFCYKFWNYGKETA